MTLINRLKAEHSLILSALSLILVAVFHQDLFQDYSLALSLTVFFILFIIIIYAAMGVVHHAEILAYKFGEPFGTLILTFTAITVEIIMITEIMLNGDEDPTFARDTIFSTVMILLNGLIGLSMIIGGFKFGEQFFNLKSSVSFFSMILIVTGLGLIFPSIPHEGGHEKPYQIFLIIVCLSLYAFFVRMQTKEHKMYFSYSKHKMLSEIKEEFPGIDIKKESAVYHSIIMVIAIVLISILAEYLSTAIDNGVYMLGLPKYLASFIVALVIISPESLTAIRAARNNEMQRTINIALGSALSTITLTIPAVIIVGFITGQEIILALTPYMTVMLLITIIIGILSTSRGEANALQGFIHFVLFATYIFIIFLFQ